jgi:2-polyprenyl-6-methoxyphenol hydroxylase-like FAD-dependent oxidoreductase
MSEKKPITIVGGGLAGLTLGIALRRQDVPVTIHESGEYPRHRVCGEFISGRGQAALARFELLELCDHAGAVPARTAAFFSTTRSTGPRPLPSSALCLSRLTLDAALAERFRALGGDLLCGRKFTADFSEGNVRATGRRAGGEAGGARWFGLKIHTRHVTLAADLEMHVSPDGYVGLCKIGGDEVNVCGLFRKRTDDNAGARHWSERLRGPDGSPLNRRLASAEFDENSFCAIAGLSLSPQRAADRAEICVGDAVTMIPPVTGNGMSMAFESAELAQAPLVAWSRGELDWASARHQIALQCDATFARRLAWAKWLQRILLTPSLQEPLVLLAGHSDRFWRLAFARTR